jgi:putative oxidoreductase
MSLEIARPVDVDRRPQKVLEVFLGAVYLWFGALKLAGVSPMVGFLRAVWEPLGGGPLFILLALFEVTVGIALVAGIARKAAAAGILAHLAGTFVAMALVPHLMFKPCFPVLTLEGEFVVKNLVFAAAAAAIVRGSR